MNAPKQPIKDVDVEASWPLQADDARGTVAMGVPGNSLHHCHRRLWPLRHARHDGRQSAGETLIGLLDAKVQVRR